MLLALAKVLEAELRALVELVGAAFLAVEVLAAGSGLRDLAGVLVAAPPTIAILAVGAIPTLDELAGTAFPELAKCAVAVLSVLAEWEGAVVSALAVRGVVASPALAGVAGSVGPALVSVLPLRGEGRGVVALAPSPLDAAMGVRPLLLSLGRKSPRSRPETTQSGGQAQSSAFVSSC